MAVGMPVIAADQPTFFFAPTIVSDSSHTSDQGGTPFNPTYRPTRSQAAGVKVACAVDYKDSASDMGAVGAVSTSGVVLTLLDEDYEVIKGFSYVVIGGNKYTYERTEVPMGLVSVGVYTIHCLADDEG